MESAAVPQPRRVRGYAPPQLPTPSLARPSAENKRTAPNTMNTWNVMTNATISHVRLFPAGIATDVSRAVVSSITPRVYAA